MRERVPRAIALLVLVAGCYAARERADAGSVDARPGVRDTGPDPRDAFLRCRASEECDDGRFCNGIERCAAGRCLPGVEPVCDDGVFCTRDACDEGLDTCSSFPDPRRCDEGKVCDPVRDCISRGCTSDIECDDGLACNGLERCAPGGTCEPGVALECDDGLACTEDRCVEPVGCEHVPPDRDRDGFADAACGGGDCDDADASRNPGAVERCSGEIDDDCDGRIDCGDDACAGRPPCPCPPTEACGERRDADCDGLTDCSDPDCRFHSACFLPCRYTDLDRRLGFAIARDTTAGRPDSFTPECAISSASDRLYRWTAPFDGRFAVDTVGSFFDTVLYTMETCPGPNVDCSDDAPGLGTASRIELTLRAGDTVLIVIDGRGTASGEYVINLRAL